VAVHKLRTNRQLTAVDLEELERMLRESGTGTSEDIDRAKAGTNGLGLFVRSLVGLDRGAAKAAFAGFLEGRTLTARQIEFINLIVDVLTERGVVNAARLYEQPFTSLSAQGPEVLFGEQGTDGVVNILDAIQRSAAA